MGLIFAAGYLGAGSPVAAAQDVAQDVTAPIEVAEAASVETTAAAGAPAASAAQIVRVSLPGPAARPFRANHGQTDLECLTQAIYYEARGEGRAGQSAVAQVVLNRVRHPSFPRSVCAVVFQDCQFSFACDGSMGARRNTRAWDRARKIAGDALSGSVFDRVGNATHFHTINISPRWSPRMIRVGQVGLHVFYRFPGRRGAPGAFSEEGVPSTAPGQHEYRRLTPEERIYLTSAVLKTPKITVGSAETGMGGPLGPVDEPASAPAAIVIPPVPSAKPVKATGETPMVTAQTPGVAAS